MLLDRYSLEGVSEVLEVSEPLLGERIDSRKSYFTKLNRVRAGDKKRSFSGVGSRSGNVFSARGYSQRVAVKIHYKKHSSGSAGAGNLRGHLGYITRDGSGLDGDRPELFGNALGVNEDISRSDFYNLCAGDRHHFRIIISPENGHELGDFEGYVTRVMGLVEKDLGTKLEWVSAVHRDTDHVHAHVVLRGRDDQGKDLVIAPDYISAGIRGVASEVATEILGERSLEDIQLGMAGEVSALRVTSLDRFIESRGVEVSAPDGDGVEIRVKSRDLGRDGGDAFYNGLVAKRLAFLSTTSMARVEGHGVYYVRSDFMEELRGISEKHDIIKQLHRVMPDEERGVNVYKIEEGVAPTVYGEIEKIAHMNELTDNKYMVVRDACDDLHYVTLGLNDRNTSLRAGSFVEVSAGEQPSLKADRRILEVSSANEGVYSRELHLSYVSEHMSYIKEPDGYVDYHGRRVDALEKAGIVEALDGGGYRVPEDAVELGFALSLEQGKKYKKRQQAQVKSLSVLPILDRGFKVYDVSDEDTPNVMGRIEQIGLINAHSDRKYMLVRDGNEQANYVSMSMSECSKELVVGAIVEVSASSGQKKHIAHASVKVISAMPIDTQIDANARTFLDLEIYRHQKNYDLAYSDADKGTLDAMSQRQDWLAENGHAYHKEDTGAFVMKGDALGKLYDVEMESVAVRLSKKFDAPVKNLDKTEKQVVQFFGYTEIYSGQYMIVGQDGAVSLIKGKFDVSKVRIGEALNVDPTGKHTKVARIIFDRNKEEAIDRVSKKFGMDYEEMHVTENVRVGFIGAVNLRDDVYAAVEHNNLLSFVKVREYPIYESGQELEVSSGKGGFVEINEVEDQKELKLEQEKEIDDDWGGF